MAKLLLVNPEGRLRAVQSRMLQKLPVQQVISNYYADAERYVHQNRYNLGIVVIGASVPSNDVFQLIELCRQFGLPYLVIASAPEAEGWKVVPEVRLVTPTLKAQALRDKVTELMGH